MQLFFYKCLKPNFGDELNTWMWPKIIQDVWDEDDNSIFVGIGSVINDKFPADKTKIVFGAGYGGYTALPVIDKNWKFYFVRGKLTAKAVGIDEKLGIGDSAILLRSCIKNKVQKRYPVSYMPHYSSTFDGNWELACKLGSINYIDPTASVDVVLEQILASDLVITEAMHGAIVSDALRVPWIPVKPLADIHSMKWFDWASALDIDLKPTEIVSSSLLESVVLYFHDKNPSIAGKFRRRGRFLLNLVPEVFAQKAADRLQYISKHYSPCLSSDAAIENAHEQMLSKLDELIIDLGKGKLVY
ncbi:MAG: polysaccharide pyruvyl transferase family protein [Methylophilaceae bacterium]